MDNGVIIVPGGSLSLEREMVEMFEAFERECSARLYTRCWKPGGSEHLNVAEVASLRFSTFTERHVDFMNAVRMYNNYRTLLGHWECAWATVVTELDFKAEIEEAATLPKGSIPLL